MLHEDDILAAIANHSDAKDALRVIVRLVIREVAMCSNATPPTADLITVGPMTIDRLRHTVTVKGVVHHFKPREYALLEALARRPGIVSSRERLLDVAWPDDKDVADRTVDVHVARIRRKIGRSVKIRTVPGAGYTLDAPED